MALYSCFYPGCLPEKEKKEKPPEKLRGPSLVAYLLQHPDTKKKFPHLNKLVPFYTVFLLRLCPQFAGQCNMMRLCKFYSGELLEEQPGLLDRIDPAKVNWVKVLSSHPELIKRMPANKRLSKGSWVEILCHQPGLWDVSPFHRFNTEDWARLILYQPQLADKCPWKELTFSPEWEPCLLMRKELVQSYREDWKSTTSVSGFYGHDFWESLLMVHPQFVKYCNVRSYYNYRASSFAPASSANVPNWSIPSDIQMPISPLTRLYAVFFSKSTRIC